MSSPDREHQASHLDDAASKMTTVDLPAIQQQFLDNGVSEVQVCRTCTKTDTQRIIIPLKQIASTKKANGGVLPPEAICHPNLPLELRRISATKDIEKIDAKGKVKVHLQTRAERAATAALMQTCGQQLQDKCTTCARLHRVTARVPGGRNDSGRLYFVEVLVGGYCTIPEEGILINGTPTFCDKQPIKPDPLEPRQNCSTCRWNSSFGENHMLPYLHATPLRMDLTAYEQEMVRQHSEPGRVGAAFSEARKKRGQTRREVGPWTKQTTLAWTGMLKFYRLDVAKIHEDEQGRRISVDLRIPQSGDVINFNLAEGNDRIGMVTIIDTRHAILEITSPHHRAYGLPDNDFGTVTMNGDNRHTCPTCHGNKVTIMEYGNKVRTHGYADFSSGQWKDVRCDRCGGTGLVGENLPEEPFVQADLSDRVDPRCTQCKGKVPCQHHLRMPRDEDNTDLGGLHLTNGVVLATHELHRNYTYNGTRVVTRISNPKRTLHLNRSEGKVQVVDEEGNPPEYTLFRIRYRSILGWCKTADERAQVMHQFTTLKRTQLHSKPFRLDYSWILPAPVDAWHPYCSLNLYDKEHGHPDVGIWTGDASNLGSLDGVLTTARGIDFTTMWNDKFGTPRGDMSTNIIMESFGSREIKKDPKFSWPKAQETEEWMRVTSPGEIVQDEFLASLKQFQLERRGRNVRETTPMPEDVTVIDCGVGIPDTKVTIDDREFLNPAAMASDRIPNPNFGKPLTTETLMEWLAGDTWLPGNDEAAGSWVSNRWALLGYENYRNVKRMREDDIPTVFDFRHNTAVNDESTAEQESLGGFICDTCYDPTDPGGAGRYTAEEITSRRCPNPECDGHLWAHPSDEFRQGNLRYTPSQVDPDEPYRRRSGSADTQSWQTTQRLQEMSCPFWEPRRNW